MRTELTTIEAAVLADHEARVLTIPAIAAKHGLHRAAAERILSRALLIRARAESRARAAAVLAEGGSGLFHGGRRTVYVPRRSPRSVLAFPAPFGGSR